MSKERFFTGKRLKGLALSAAMGATLGFTYRHMHESTASITQTRPPLTRTLESALFGNPKGEEVFAQLVEEYKRFSKETLFIPHMFRLPSGQEIILYTSQLEPSFIYEKDFMEMEKFFIRYIKKEVLPKNMLPPAMASFITTYKNLPSLARKRPLAVFVSPYYFSCIGNNATFVQTLTEEEKYTNCASQEGGVFIGQYFSFVTANKLEMGAALISTGETPKIKSQTNGRIFSVSDHASRRRKILTTAFHEYLHHQSAIAEGRIGMVMDPSRLREEHVVINALTDAYDRSILLPEFQKNSPQRKRP